MLAHMHTCTAEHIELCSGLSTVWKSGTFLISLRARRPAYFQISLINSFHSYFRALSAVISQLLSSHITSKNPHLTSSSSSFSSGAERLCEESSQAYATQTQESEHSCTFPGSGCISFRLFKKCSVQITAHCEFMKATLRERS